MRARHGGDQTTLLVGIQAIQEEVPGIAMSVLALRNEDVIELITQPTIVDVIPRLLLDDELRHRHDDQDPAVDDDVILQPIQEAEAGCLDNLLVLLPGMRTGTMTNAVVGASQLH